MDFGLSLLDLLTGSLQVIIDKTPRANELTNERTTSQRIVVEGVGGDDGVCRTDPIFLFLSHYLIVLLN